MGAIKVFFEGIIELMGDVAIFAVSLICYALSLVIAMLIFVLLRHYYPTFEANGNRGVILVIWFGYVFLPIFLYVYCFLLPRSLRNLYSKIESEPPYIKLDKKDLEGQWLIFSYSKSSKALREFSLAGNPELEMEVKRSIGRWDKLVELLTMPLHLMHLTHEVGLLWIGAIIIFSKYLPLLENWVFGTG